MELARSHADGDVLIMVTHREGIWELCRHVGARPAGGYCNTTFFMYDGKNHHLASWNPSSHTLRDNASVVSKLSQRFKGAEKTSAKLASPTQANVTPIFSSTEDVENEPTTLDAVLAAGSGDLIMHRGGTGDLTTLLWRTPGVRGVWVEGGSIPDGETVTLLSTPQRSEGDEGDFVLVRRSSGVEGWTKIKNLHLPSHLQSLQT